MEDKRKSKRVTYKKKVKFGLVKFGPPPNPPRHEGQVLDISEDGIFIKTDTVFQTGIRLKFEIKDGKKSYRIEGKVTNAHKLPKELADEAKNGMGIIIEKPDAELLKLYNDKIKD